jgi:periplasmic protein TonB
MSGAPLPLHPAALGAGASPAAPPTRAAAFVPPPLPRRGARRDALSPAQRHAMVGAIVALHALAVWSLMQIREVRDAVADVAPMFVSLVAPEPPKALPPPPPPPPVARPVPRKLAPVVIAAAPTPAPPAFVVAPPPVEVVVPPPAVAVVAPPLPAPPAPPAPPPQPQPKLIPASAVQYLGDPPVPDYPRLSIRTNETGRVMLRIQIDEAGLPRGVAVEKSSGHVRLDEAAVAAMRKARFKPYTENGQAVAGWAFVPLDFALEK